MNKVLDPSDHGEELIHRRDYEVTAYRVRSQLVRLRGVLRDVKPAGLHFEHDPSSLTIHHMIVDLLIDLPEMTITDVQVVFEAHPHKTCPRIIDHYQGLVGLSVARGFTHRVRELFGGPRGCTHTTALLQAMGPAMVQAAWSMQVLDERERPVDFLREPPTPEERRRRWVPTVNTCHVWDADGDLVTRLEAGGDLDPPIAFFNRAEELGVPETIWRRQFER